MPNQVSDAENAYGAKVQSNRETLLAIGIHLSFSLENSVFQTCLSLKEEDEMIAKEKAENNNKNTATQPLSSAKESGFVKDSLPQPHVGEGNSGGTVAAGVVSVLIVILVITGFTYMVTRTRALPRLRARITNKPYEDIIINDRGQQAAASAAQQQPSASSLA